MTKYGFIKPAIDAHTIGINAVSELLRECGFNVTISPRNIAENIVDYKSSDNRLNIIKWVIDNSITRLGISYRLDEEDAYSMMSSLVTDMRLNNIFDYQGGNLVQIYFGGLPSVCQRLEIDFHGLVKTFHGSESPSETLMNLGVDEERIPIHILEGNRYDLNLIELGRTIISSQSYIDYKPKDRGGYSDFGTKDDSLVARINFARINNALPLMRAHVGPYHSNLTREDSVNDFLHWVEALAKTNYLDIISIGTSQLTQSHFGLDWQDKTNGGGVPVNSIQEYKSIWEASRPMLLRTYAGTFKMYDLAKIHEVSINISWHALSIWWFNKLDDRGPYDLYSSLREQFRTIEYVASTKKPFEANVGHHFAFRGADDLTYISSIYLAAKLAKIKGIKVFVLQNMLNTPRLTWGIQDLAKSRAVLTLVRRLEDENFQVILQPRAGLDFFKPNLEESKVQLAAVTALMDDIEPDNSNSPEVIHVVSYSESLHLANPDVIDESVKITQKTLEIYRLMKSEGKLTDFFDENDVMRRKDELIKDSEKLINHLEETIIDLYTPEGFYLLLAAGYFPIPYLWSEVDEFRNAKNWRTKPINGGFKLIDAQDTPIGIARRIKIANQNLENVKLQLSSIILNSVLQ